MKSGNLNFLEPSGPLQVCNGTALPFFMIYMCRQAGLKFVADLTAGPEATLEICLFSWVWQGCVRVMEERKFRGVSLCVSET